MLPLAYTAAAVTLRASPPPDGEFAALDFELASTSLDSVCALAVVNVRGQQIVDRYRTLIRPPGKRFTFERLHGIGAEAVADAPPLADCWARLSASLTAVSFVAAHNARFEMAVLAACARRFSLPLPKISFLCTMGLARREFGLARVSLPAVCRELGIDLRHHDPMSDAEAAARIVMACRERER